MTGDDMTLTEKTLRKAVELADGWAMHGATVWGNEHHTFLTLDDQIGIDALAAQLVRQVRDKGLWCETSYPEDKYGWPQTDKGFDIYIGEDHCSEFLHGQDESEARIFAIVDSGALE